ncbi:MAG TPA: sugar ABC transporter permease [Polyangiaceae bacterium]
MRPRHPRDPFWMMLPTGALLAVFFFYPLVFAAYISLFRWDLLTEPVFVGFANYRVLLESGELAHAFLTTLSFSVVVVAGSMSLGLVLALALNRPGKFPAFVRAAIFSAYVVSWVSVALLWLWVLDPSAGVATSAVRALGGPGIDWLGDPGIALYTLALVTIWKIAGYSMVLFTAGLQDVPKSLIEAAALDGASSLARFRNVTWPLLRPTTAFVATTSLILSFQVFDVVRVMTQGGPVRSTTVFVYAIYEQVFMNLRVGRASAEVVVFFLLLLGLTLIQLSTWRKKARARA